MNTIRWPQWLPNPQKDSYNYQPEDRRQKTDMEIGSVYRKEFDTDATKLQCSLWLSGIESDFFEVFERDILEQGSKWFEFPIKVGGSIEYHLVRFAERPKMNRFIGFDTQEYSLALILSKRNVENEEFIGVLLYINPEDLAAMSQRLHYVLHTQIPTTLDIPAWRDYE